MMSNYKPVAFPPKLNIRMRHTLALGLSSLLFIQPALALGSPFPAAPGSFEVPGYSSSLGNPAAESLLPEAEGLTIEILEGEGALNNIRQRTAREPIVQVEDKNHKPVAGALVLFAIQSGPGGASGTVAGGATFSVRTGVDGKAQLKGLKPNNLSGEFTITVTATVGSLVATAIIHQKNETGVGGGNTSSPNTVTNTTGEVVRHSRHYVLKATLIGGVAVTAVVLAVVLTQKSSGATITAGTGTVAQPSVR